LEKSFIPSKSDALIIVDVQMDFCPGGALPVPDGDQVVPVLNDYMKLFTKSNAKIFATRDWHPPNHISFKQQGGPWPPHCIQQSDGAQFHPDLKLPSTTMIISKATDPNKESYSGFDGTQLSAELKTQGVTRVFVGGLATDYCVKSTVLDALKLGYKTVLLLDATRGIDTTPGDVEKAINEMTANEAEEATSADFPDGNPEIPEEAEPDVDEIEEKPLAKAAVKKKARRRSRGPYRKIKTER
jgi:nicotinamidase/pyrazinamidase